MGGRALLLDLLVVVWAAGIVFGAKQLMDYANAPGAFHAPPAFWPESSRLPEPADKPTVVMFVHPKCPCSRASLSNLERVLASDPGALVTYVAFVLPEGRPQSWSETSLWRKALQIPGIVALVDPGGAEARAFGAQTSGHTLAYGEDGRLLFSGGITTMRAHEGDNEATDALRAIAAHEPFQVTSAPIFGCPLLDEQEGDGNGAGAAVTGGLRN